MDSQIIKLVVIDDKQTAKILADNLKNYSDIKVLACCADGSGALDTIKEHKPDVVVMDLVMPSKDGFAILNELSEAGLAVRPKVIILSALSNESFVHKAMQSGADYYMLKPYESAALADRIFDLCRAAGNNTAQIQLNIDRVVESYRTDNMPRVSVKNKNLEERITNIFITVGIPAHIKGYQFLREAIKMAIDSPDIINSITKKLYPSIADRFETSPSKVERAIRHAIEVAWNRGKIENINNIFGLQVYSSNEKPTNGEFIALVADKMLIEGA